MAVGHLGKVALPVEVGQYMVEAAGALGGQALAKGSWLCTVMTKNLGDMIPVPGNMVQ